MVCVCGLELADLNECFVKLGLEILGVADTFVLLGQSVLIRPQLLIERVNLQVQLLDLLSKRLLDRVRVKEALNFLGAEQEFVLDQRFHVDIALNHCF